MEGSRHDAQTVKASASGRWHDVFIAAGIPEDSLSEKNGPCPKCGGADRFRFIDRDAGALYCNQCFNERNGDGFAALQWWGGIQFPEAVSFVASCLNLSVPTSNGKAKGKKPMGRIVCEYIYSDELGAELFRVCRMEPKDFRQCAFDLASGRRTWSTKNIRKVPYRLRELLGADLSKVVFVCEGEKDVDRLLSLGLVATTNPGGAGKWRKEYGEHLRDRLVVVLADNDDAGRKHVQDVAKKLKGLAASIKVVELAGIPEKGDVSDWLDAGGTVEQLLSIVTETPEWTPREKPQDDSTSDKAFYRKTDYGNAERLRDRHRDHLLYCHPWKKWLFWDGTRWDIDNQGEIQQRGKETIRAMYREAAELEDMERRKSLCEFAIKSESDKRLQSMIAMTRDELPICPSEFDSHPWLLNCPNGTLNLRTGELRPHQQQDRITKLCPTIFDPDAQSYAWDQFLEGIFDGDAELIAFIQRWFGYCLTGDVREQILPIFWGTGSNGKSTLLNAIMHAMGTDYSMKAPHDLLTVTKGDRHPTAMADLFRIRFMVAIETGEGGRLNEVFVKETTGGDIIRARRMREDFWQFQPTHKTVLCTNHAPVIRGTDWGIWRRLALIPFLVRFWNPAKGESGPPELRRDNDLEEKLKAEASGILAWATRGCLEWQRNGLAMPASVIAATAGYQDEQDVIRQFIDECCVTLPQIAVKAGDVFDRYRGWCERTGEFAVNQRRFGQALTERGFVRFTNNGTFYRGLALRTEGTEGTEPTFRIAP